MASITQAQLKELHNVVSKHTTDEIVVSATPGVIKNSGKNVFAVKTLIGNNNTKKINQFMYRGESSQYEKWLKDKIDEIKKKA